MLLQFLFTLLFSLGETLNKLEWRESLPGEFPYMVWMSNIVPSFYGNLTSVGVLISEKWVLADGMTVALFNLTNDYIMVSRDGMKPDDEKEGVTIFRKFVHRDFAFEKLNGVKVISDNSIGLLELSTPISMNQGYSTINLPKEPLTSEVILTHVTWNLTAGPLLVHKIKFMDWEECKKLYALESSYFKINRNMICSEKVLNEITTDGPYIEHNKWFVEDTIVALFTTNDDMFTDGNVFVGVDVGKYRGWIKSITGI